ncbi:unnamed protein product, partial [Rotaria sp. Silwood2]
PIGSYCDKADEPPKPCPAGFFCLEGQTTGTPCPTGYQTTLTGQSHYCPNPDGNPILCQPGYANNKHGRVECDLCPSGSFADVAGLAYCVTCPPGYICTNARTAPMSCPLNKARGQTICPAK